MAELTMSDSVKSRIASVTLHLVTPSDIHISTISGYEIDLARGVVRWQGSVAFGECDKSLADDADEIEAFISSLEGRRHSFILPIYRDAVPQDFVIGDEISIGDLIYYRVPSSEFIGVSIGQFVRILAAGSDRLYQVVRTTLDNQVALVPNLAGLTGMTGRSEAEIRAKRLGSNRRRGVPWGMNFMGPWQFNWQEWI